VNYVRGNYTGIWTNFTGQLNVISNAINPVTAAHDFRVFNALGFPNARMHLDTSSLFWRGAANAVVPIGELTGAENAFISGTGGAEGGNAVTWRVGRLNTDATYAGTSGGTVAVGFIKEGTGRWTLTGINSYAGNTTVSNGVLALSTNAIGANGEILSSPVITVVAPGALSVTNRTDGTLTLGTGGAQTLAGNGNIFGNVTIAGLAVLSPGFSIGTITVSGDATNNAGYLVEVNRAATPNSDRLVARNIDLSGATIMVTNIGSSLVVIKTERE
jgi:autotransporter-associated beta strand protein